MEYDVTLQTIAWFNELREMKKLQISPKFQRRAVWLDKERSELMDTICSELPFPEVYIHVITDKDTGKQQYIVVDGQQRITSIFKFLDGEITLPSTSKWESSTFADLDAEMKPKFWNYKIVVRQLSNTNEAEIRDLFQRLNTNNFSLNDQELRNARYSGKFKQAAERLADDPFFQSIGLFTAREVRRMEDIEYVSELLILLIAGIQNKKDTLEDYYAAYNEDFPNESHFELEFKTTINLLQQITNVENQSVVKTKSNFYSLFGACLRYFRATKRASFKQAEGVSKSIGDLLFAARAFRPDLAAPSIVTDYYDAVSRAASDKQRRAQREEILFGLIAKAERL